MNKDDCSDYPVILEGGPLEGEIYYDFQDGDDICHFDNGITMTHHYRRTGAWCHSNGEEYRVFEYRGSDFEYPDHGWTIEFTEFAEEK